jgi:hypothetical protein
VNGAVCTSCSFKLIVISLLIDSLNEKHFKYCEKANMLAVGVVERSRASAAESHFD